MKIVESAHKHNSSSPSLLKTLNK